MKFQAINNLEPVPPAPKRPPLPLWMSPKSIWLIDVRAALRRNPRHNHNVSRDITKSVRISLLVDSRRRFEEAATAIGAFLDPAAG